MAKIKPRVKVPKKAAAGEIVEIKALISHPCIPAEPRTKNWK
jgi:sulfur-oxidizing protein SoxZ